jgi:hypothetical protein
MTEAQKKWIDDSDYESLLQLWRFSKDSEPLLQGECGNYYKKVMFQKRDAVGPEEAVRASKSVGWDR